MKTQHTPTPDQITDWLNDQLWSADKVPICEAIRLAVNSHAALLEIAKRVAIPNWHIESTKCFHCQALEAIQQAEGK